MNLVEATILGAIQGFTEWLPISSSGHIFLIETYFSLTPSIELAAWLHGGSFLAVLIFYHKRIWEMLIGLFAFLRAYYLAIFTQEKHNKIESKEKYFSTYNHNRQNAVFAIKIVLATLISAPIILLLERSSILYGFSIQIVALTLGITGVFIVASEYLPKKSQEISWALIVFFGLVQSLAAFPGISRSGITIALLLLLGVTRKKSS